MTTQEQYEHLVETVKGYNPAAGFDQIRAAYEFADTHHAGQNRKDGSPFITHPLAVAQIVAEELHLDTESIVAALLHDTIEDTTATHEELAKLFSPTVADLVEGVSKLTRVQYVSKRRRADGKPAQNAHCDERGHPRHSGENCRPAAQYAHHGLPDRGKAEAEIPSKPWILRAPCPPPRYAEGEMGLEDRSLRYLDPVGYRDINDRLEVHRAEHEAFMAHIRARLKNASKEIQVDYTKVYGRIKHTYSIYRKCIPRKNP